MMSRQQKKRRPRHRNKSLAATKNGSYCKVVAAFFGEAFPSKPESLPLTQEIQLDGSATPGVVCP